MHTQDGVSRTNPVIHEVQLTTGDVMCIADFGTLANQAIVNTLESDVFVVTNKAVPSWPLHELKAVQPLLDVDFLLCFVWFGLVVTNVIDYLLF